MSVRFPDITGYLPRSPTSPSSSPSPAPSPTPAPDCPPNHLPRPYAVRNTRVPTQRREPHVYGCDTAPGSNAYSKFSRGRRARATESLVLRPDYSTERGARVRKFGYFISRALTVPPPLFPPPHGQPLPLSFRSSPPPCPARVSSRLSALGLRIVRSPPHLLAAAVPASPVFSASSTWRATRFNPSAYVRGYEF